MLRRRQPDPRQLAFPFGETPSAARAGREVLFFLVRPPEALALILAELPERIARQHSMALAARPARQLHVSLLEVAAFRSSLGREAAERAMRAAAALAARRCLVSFDRICSFAARPPCPLVLRGGEGTEALGLLRGDLAGHLARVGLMRPRAAQAFTPHVTLAYGDVLEEEIRLDSPVAWTLDEVLLVKSHQGQTRHEVLARWPLMAAG